MENARIQISGGGTLLAGLVLEAFFYDCLTALSQQRVRQLRERLFPVVAKRSTSEILSTPAKVSTQQAEGLTHMLGERCRVFHGREVTAVLGFREEAQIVETRLRPAP